MTLGVFDVMVLIGGFVEALCSTLWAVCKLVEVLVTAGTDNAGRHGLVAPSGMQCIARHGSGSLVVNLVCRTGDIDLRRGVPKNECGKS
jgi:hypothetical protein